MDVQYGFPREIFSSVPDERFICQLCLEVLREPVQCNNGHLFCRCCLDRALKSNRKCPTCRQKLSGKKMSASLITKSFISDLTVRCITTLNEGDSVSMFCNWTGRSDELINHLNSNCQFVYTNCSNEGCSVIVSRCELSEHMTRCDWTLQRCHQCNDLHTNFNMLNHCMVECNNRPVICPNRCSSTLLKQSEVDAHLRHVCPLVLVQCAYHEAGCGPTCDGFVRRGDKVGHENNTENMRCVIAALFEKINGGASSSTANSTDIVTTTATMSHNADLPTTTTTSNSTHDPLDCLDAIPDVLFRGRQLTRGYNSQHPHRDTGQQQRCKQRFRWHDTREGQGSVGQMITIDQPTVVSRDGAVGSVSGTREGGGGCVIA